MTPEQQRDRLYGVAEELAVRLGGDYSRRDLGGNPCETDDGEGVLYSVTLTSTRAPQPLEADLPAVEQLLRERGLEVGVLRKSGFVRVGGTGPEGIVDYEAGPAGHTIGAATACTRRE